MKVSSEPPIKRTRSAPKRAGDEGRVGRDSLARVATASGVLALLARLPAICLSLILSVHFFVLLHIPRLRFSLRTKDSIWGRGISSAYYAADDATITTTGAARRPTWIVAAPKVEKNVKSNSPVVD